MILPLALISTFLVNSAAAHTIFRELTVNGVAQGVNKGIRVPSYNGPVTDVTTNSIICNGPPNPLITPYDQTIITVPAGATVAASFYHSEAYPIDPSHKGPIMAYLAKVNSALQEDVTGLKWFKIYEDGLHSDGTWAVDTMLANGGKTSFTIPSCIAPGNYFLRVELIALHGAGTYPGAQFYMECAQINVTGGGSASPATVSFPGAYAGSDPGITVNIYYPPLTNYVIPGPRPFTCGGTNTSASSSSSRTTSTTSTRSSTSTTSTRSSSSSSSTSRSSSSSSSGGAALYGQCGGQGWTGPTTCAQGTCTVSNQWYSQCLP